jgi:magnesium-transporting ATPase (P-type)
MRPEKGASFVRVVMKGAVDVVLDKCTSQIGNSDEVRRLDYAGRNDIKSELNSYAKNFGHRIFAYAYKDLNSEEWER